MKLKSVILIPLTWIFSFPVLSDDGITNAPYNWTGVYVGGFIGGASSANINTTEPNLNSSGGSYSWNHSNNSYNYDTSASFIGGGTVGYNWQIAKTAFLLGLEGEYGYLDMSGQSIDPNSASTAGSDGSHSTNIGGSYGYGLVGGRIGYAVDRALVYIKSGAVFTSTQTGYTDACSTGSCGIGLLNTSSKGTNTGYALGVGVEYALPFEWSQNISVKTEYLYFGIDKTQISSETCCDGATTFLNTDNISGIHTAKVGVNYKF